MRVPDTVSDDPSGWEIAARNDSMYRIIDTLLEADQGYKFSKSELADEAGISRESLYQYLPTLVDCRVVRLVDSGGYDKVQFNPSSRVSRAIIELEAAIEACDDS
jgi:predicted AAA+ superfamily ATPase